MESNPYAPPEAAGELPSSPIVPQGEGPLPWSVGEVFGEAWSALTLHAPVLIGAPLIGHAIVFMGSGTLLVALLAATGLSTEDLASPEPDPSLGAVFPLWSLALAAGVAFVSIGVARLQLSAARGEAPAFTDLFSGASRLLSLLLAGVLLGLAFFVVYVSAAVATALAAVGAFLGSSLAGVAVMVLVPFSIALFLAVPLLVGECLLFLLAADSELGAVEILRRSWALTRGQKSALFGLFLSGGLLVAVSLLACGLGPIVAIPLVQQALAVVYTRLTGTTRVASAEPVAYPKS